MSYYHPIPHHPPPSHLSKCVFFYFQQRTVGLGERKFRLGDPNSKTLSSQINGKHHPQSSLTEEPHLISCEAADSETWCQRRIDWKECPSLAQEKVPTFLGGSKMLQVLAKWMPLDFSLRTPSLFWRNKGGSKI